MKIVSIVGARPQFIKCAPLSKELRKEHEEVHTGQHCDREMSEIFFEELVLRFMGSAEKILTDSEGIQKEAYMLRVPRVTLRENTEWVETLEGGWNVMAGADKSKVVEAAHKFAPIVAWKKVFGISGASERIVHYMIFDYHNSYK